MSVQIEAGRQQCKAEVQGKVNYVGLQSEESKILRKYVYQSSRCHEFKWNLEQQPVWIQREQLDVKIVFYMGSWKKIYMVQPERFIEKVKEKLIYKLKKSSYGLKQAPNQWHHKFASLMVDQGYTGAASNHCVYVKKFDNGDFIVMLNYVDDMLIIG